jgi:serine/threonine-protein kinase HipA
MVTVKAWGRVVAKLKEEDGIYYFSLSPDNPLNFSPMKLKERGKTYEFSSLSFQNGLPGLINDSLPGVYGKEYLDEFFLKHFKTTPNVLETLQFLGENTMGALTYEPALEQMQSFRKNLILEASELYNETKKALLGEADFSINEIIAISNSAAAGARPKAIVGFNEETKKMHVGLKYSELPEGYKHSIVKFDNLLNGVSDFEKSSQTIGEYLYYLAATKAGIKMSPSYLVESKGYHFVTERFDIIQSDSGLQRFHMHSLSGMMHHNPSETTFGYENICI